MYPSPTASVPSPRWLPWVVLALPVALIVWAYWTTLGNLAEAWATSAQYSHGYLVPAFALVLLWLRRDRLKNFQARPSQWGAVLVSGGIIMRLFGTYAYYLWLDQISLIPCLAGLVLLAGGRAAWRWAGPAILFLAFMVPLPYTVAIALTDPLQRLATTCSTFALQTLGLPAIAEGNVILLNDVRLGVVEACSGLRMLVIFFALSTAVALVRRRPGGQRVAVVISAVPIALATNVLRITVTGVMHETVGAKVADAIYHDLAGWLMMPVALALLWVELQILKRLFLETPESSPQTAKITFARIALQPTRSTRRPMNSAPTPVPVEAAPSAPA
jgi:exosortase